MNIFFDAKYYLQSNPDVLQAITMGLIPDAKFHFDNFGWKEGRDPNATFDVSYYLEENSDVLAAGVNPLDHFIQFGAAEGRLPNADFVSFEDFDTDAYAAANQDLDAAGLTTPEQLYAHFATYGFGENRPGTQTTDGTPIVDGLPGGLAGDDFTLTDGVDEFIGTAGNDTFQGLVEDLSNFDDLAGGAGDDVLNLYVEGSGTDVATSSTVDVEGIETVNFIYDNSATSITGTIDGDTFQGATQIWQIGDTQAIEDLAATQTAGFRDTGVSDDVDAAAGAESLTIALDGVESGSDFYLGGADVTTVNFSGSMETTGESDLNIYAAGKDLPDLETINFAMTTDTQINSYGTALGSVVTVDASGSTGDIALQLLGVNSIPEEALDLETLSTGSGDDAVMLDMAVLGADATAVNLGTGNDMIMVDVTNSMPDEEETLSDVATALTIATGAGEDQVFLDGFNVELVGDGDPNFALSEDELDGNTVTITGFNADEDLVIIDGFDGFSAQNAVNQIINQAGVETLSDAVNELAAVIGSDVEGITNFAKFNFGSDTYIYGEVGEGEAMLVGFTGVVAVGSDNVIDTPLV